MSSTPCINLIYKIPVATDVNVYNIRNSQSDVVVVVSLASPIVLITNSIGYTNFGPTIVDILAS